MPALNAYKQNKSYTGAQALFKTIGKLIFGGMHEIWFRLSGCRVFRYMCISLYTGLDLASCSFIWKLNFKFAN